MTITNQLINTRQDLISEKEHIDFLMSSTDCTSYCVARYYNEDYCITLVVWRRNMYSRSLEIGVRNLKTDAFKLDQQRSWSTVTRRFNRLARLIQGGRALDI